MKIVFLKNLSRGVATLLLLFSITILQGCVGKKKVTFVPRESHIQHSVPKKIKTQAGFYHRRDDPVKAKLIQQYASWSGTRYKLGGMTRRGIDCSGFVQITFQHLFHKTLPRTVNNQAKMGMEISRNTLKSGDLVFFKTGIRQKHVGIYLEKGSFMHVSLSKGLMVSKLNDAYWSGRYWKAKRLLQMDQIALNSTDKL